jgi:hypothetical protein
MTVGFAKFGSSLIVIQFNSSWAPTVSQTGQTSMIGRLRPLAVQNLLTRTASQAMDRSPRHGPDPHYCTHSSRAP